MSIGPVDIEFALKGNLDEKIKEVSRTIAGESQAMGKAIQDYQKTISGEFDKSKTSISGVKDKLEALKKMYNELSAEGRKSEFGKMVAQEINNVSESLNKIEPAVEKSKSSTGKLMDFAKGLLPAFGFAAILAGAKEVFSKIVSSTDALSDAWEETMGAMKGATNYFWTTLASGDWENFFTNIREASRLGREYAKTLDELGDRQRALDLKEAEARGKALELEEKMRNKNLPLKERREAGQERIKLEDDLAVTREENAQIALNNEINNNIKFKALGKEKTRQLILDIDSQDKKDAEAYNAKLNRISELKAAQVTTTSSNWGTFTSYSKAGQGEIDALNSEIAKTPETVKNYANAITQFKKANEDEYNRVKEAFVNVQEAHNSAAENTKRIRTTVNSLIAGEMKDNGDKGPTGVKKITQEIAELKDRLMEADVKDQKAIADKIVLLEQELAMRTAAADAALAAAEAEAKRKRGDTNNILPKGTLSPGLQMPEIITTKTHENAKLANVDMDRLYQAIKKSIKEGKELDKIFAKEKIKEFAGTVADVLTAVTDITNQYGEQLGLTEEQAGALNDVANMANGIADMASGNYIQGAVKIVGSIISLFDRSTESMAEHFENLKKHVEDVVSAINTAQDTIKNIGSNQSVLALANLKKELIGLYSDAVKLNTSIKNVGYGYSFPVDTDSFGNYVNKFEIIKSEIEVLTQKLLSGKLTEKQEEEVKNVLDSYNSLISAIDNITQQITGTTFRQLSDAIAEAFMNGTDAAESWGKSVNDIIKKIMVDQLTTKLLVPGISKAMDILMKDSYDGLTSGEAKAFKDSIEELASSVGPAFEAAREALKTMGIDLGASSTDTKGMTGAIQNITEETAGLIAGQFSAMRVDIKAVILEVAKGQLIMDKGLTYLSEIAVNTRHNAKLNNIDANISELLRVSKERL